MAEKKSSGALHQLWIVVKYSLVSMIVSLIQIALQYGLPYIFDSVTAVLPNWLSWIFNGEQLFDQSTAAGAVDYAKYVVNGVVTWGYVLPFFLSNFIANAFGYYENKKRTFKSTAPQWHFALYFVILTIVIIIATWMQGQIYGLCSHSDSEFIHGIARLICVAVAGLFQFIVLFFAQKALLPEDPELVAADKAKREAEEAEYQIKKAAKAAGMSVEDYKAQQEAEAPAAEEVAEEAAEAVAEVAETAEESAEETE